MNGCSQWRFAPRPILCLAIVTLALALGGCSRPQTPSGPPLKLTIAEASQPVFALLYVADAKGFLREAGLEVTFTSFRLGRDALASVIEGKADLATVFETPVVARIYEGRDLAIVSALHSSSRNQALLARRDRGISSVADLKGRKVGVSPGTSFEYLLSVMLATEGMPAASATLVPMALADHETALAAGTVDAVMTINPLALRRVLGERAMVFYSDAYTETSVLVGTREVVAGQPEAMARLAKALVRAQDYVERNKEESIRIVAARLAGVFDEAAVRELWDDLKLDAKLDNVLVSTMALEGQWMKDTGRFTGPLPDFRNAVYADYLRLARPEAVTLQSPGAPR